VIAYAVALPLAVVMIALSSIWSPRRSRASRTRYAIWFPNNFAAALAALHSGVPVHERDLLARGGRGQVVTSATAAYAFARLRFPGRDRVFLIYLCALMAPAIVLVIPRFLLIDALDGWTATKG